MLEASILSSFSVLGDYLCYWRQDTALKNSIFPKEALRAFLTHVDTSLDRRDSKIRDEKALC